MRTPKSSPPLRWVPMIDNDAVYLIGDGCLPRNWERANGYTGPARFLAMWRHGDVVEGEIRSIFADGWQTPLSVNTRAYHVLIGRVRQAGLIILSTFQARGLLAVDSGFASAIYQAPGSAAPVCKLLFDLAERDVYLGLTPDVDRLIGIQGGMLNKAAKLGGPIPERTLFLPDFDMTAIKEIEISITSIILCPLCQGIGWSETEDGFDACPVCGGAGSTTVSN